MPFKNIEKRREHYQKNKDEINKKRREYKNRPEVKAKIKEQERLWRKDNSEKMTKWNREFGKRYREKNKKLVFEHYGKECACCGESEKAFLTIDHIHGNGNKHRKQIHRKTYIWLVKNNFPKGFQTLCFNCNWGKYYNNGICPHKK